MTINLADNSPRISYSVAEGVTQTSFAVPFEFFDNGDLNVYIDGTLKTITTDYTVSGGDGSTGTVSMSVTGGTGGSTVVITRDIALERTTDFPVSGAFNIVALNTELDRLVAVAADLDDLAGRGVKLSDFDTAATLTLPLAADRINKVLAFNSAGDTLVSQELGVWKGDWAASTAYVERDLVRDSSDGSIYIVTSAHTSSGSTPLDTNTNSSKYSVIFDIGAMIAGTVTMTGDLSVQGNTTLGNAATDTVTITADVASNILPSADNTYDLGGTGAEWKDVYIDGVAYVDSIAMPTTTVTDILDEDTMSSNSATALATQQSIKAYVDSQVGSNNELSEVLGNGNTTGGTNIVVDSGDTLDVNGALDASGNITLNGSFPTGTSNVGLGSSALASVTSTSQQNTAIGANAGDSITTGDYNTAIGFQALGGATTNTLNTAIGHNALLASVGTGNIALGASSGLYLTSGSRNVIIGSYDGNEGGLDIRTSSNNLVLSDGDGNIRLYANSSGNVGIANVSPSTALDVTGTITADTITLTSGGNYRSTIDTSSIALSGGTSSNVGSNIILYGSSHASLANDIKIRRSGVDFALFDGATGDISFYEDTGTTAKFFWDASAESLGIGTSSPVVPLTLQASGATSAGENTHLRINDTTNMAANVGGVIQLSGEATTGSSDQFTFATIKGIKENGTSGNYDGALTFATRTNGVSPTAERLRIDSSGNVGIGTTSPSGIFHAKDASSSLMFKDVSGNAELFIDGSNGDFAGGDYFNIVADSSPNLMFKQANTERMRIDSSGRLLLGTTDVGVGGADEFTVATSGDTGISIRSGTSSTGNLYFADGTSGNAQYRGYVLYNHSTDHLAFGTSASEKVRIDSSGNLLVGKTVTTFGTEGIAAFNSADSGGSRINITNDGGTPLNLNRLTSDGEIAGFYKDGTQVGSIQSRSGLVSTFILDPRTTSNGGVGITATGNTSEPALLPTDETGTLASGAIDLGASGEKWRNLYLSGGVYLGGTGSANHLDDYEEGTHQSSLTPNTSGTISLTSSYDVLSYTKVGRAVTVTGDLVITSTSSPVGTSVQLSLPFTIGNLAELSGRVGGSVSLYDASVARTTKPYVGIEGNNYISVILDPSTLASSDSITISLTYFTA